MLVEESTESFREKGAARLEFWVSSELTMLRSMRLFVEIPKTIFKLDGLRCLDFTGHPITSIPPEIGLLRSLRRLVLVALHIRHLPPEVANLLDLEQLIASACPLVSVPEEVHKLTKLWDLYLDGGQLEAMPSNLPPAVDAIKISSNRLRRLPDTLPENWKITEIRAYSNKLQELPENICSLTWVKALMLHSNQLCKLPAAIGDLSGLVWLMLADNRLESLPESIGDLTALEWLYVYNNRLTALPHRLLHRAVGLKRLLLEANPISGESLQDILEDVPGSMHVLGVDNEQVRRYRQNQMATNPEAAGAPLAYSVITGWMMPWCVDGLYAKLLPASQLASSGRSADPLQDRVQRPDVLVVAFSASQGEPEWLGSVGKVLGVIEAQKRHSSLHRFEDVCAALRRDLEPTSGDAVHSDWHTGAMWHAYCCAPEPDDKPLVCHKLNDTTFMQVADFDVLCLCQSEANWYCGPNGTPLGLEEKLQSIVCHYKRTLFLGVSMGGFGALLHSHLADTVAVFGPQTNLTRSHLRPGWTPQGYELATERLRENVRAATARGVRFVYHVAVDDHLLHARALPLPQGALVVHPIVGRIARLMERAGLLIPLLADLVGELQDDKCTRPWPASTEFAQHCPPIGSPAWEWTDSTSESILLALWRPSGGMDFLAASPTVVGKIAQVPAHAGDWFCPRCCFRNFEQIRQCANCCAGYPPQRTVSYGHASKCAEVSQPHWCQSCCSGQLKYSASCVKCHGPLQYACAFCGCSNREGETDKSATMWYCTVCWQIFQKHAVSMQRELPAEWFLESDFGQTWAWIQFVNPSTRKEGVIEFAKKGVLLTTWGRGRWELSSWGAGHMRVSLPQGLEREAWILQRVEGGFKARKAGGDFDMVVDSHDTTQCCHAYGQPFEFSLFRSSANSG